MKIFEMLKPGIWAMMLIAAGQALVSDARAQQWPAKPIRIVVAFAAGGTADVFARLLAPELTAKLGQQIIVENRPGSAGTIGSAFVANAAPDGHTLLMCGSGPQITAPLINNSVGYDPITGFTHLAMVAGDGYMLVASPELGVKTLGQLKVSGRTALNTGSPGNGSLGHLLIEHAKRRTGLDLVHVPYKSGNDGLKELLGGHLGLVMSPVISASAMVRAGRVVPLGITTVDRNPAFPDVATFRQQGYDVVGLTWFWLCGPKDLPAPVADRLSTEVRRIVKLPQVKRVLDRDALITPDLAPAALVRFLADDIALWRPLIQEIGIKVQ